MYNCTIVSSVLLSYHDSHEVVLTLLFYSNCQVTVTVQLLKMTLESVETSSKSCIIIINFIVKSMGI